MGPEFESSWLKSPGLKNPGLKNPGMKSLGLNCSATFQKTADGNGESYGSEVFIMRSKDLLKLHEIDKPQEATWESLPKGDKGIHI